jgi:hypothetical protein
VKLGAGLVLVLVIVSLSMSEARFREALFFARAEKMTRAGNWAEVYEAYRGVIARHAEDTDMLLNFANAAVRSGHPADAGRTLNKLEGRRATKEQISRAKAVEQELDRLARLQAPLPASSHGVPTPAGSLSPTGVPLPVLPR